ncbi:MAG: YHS domain-containing protein, partial [Mesorhizobium sp.]
MAHSNHDHHAHASGGCCSAKEAAAVADAVVRDPVCGMSVDPATAKHSLRHEGQDFYFCSAGCKAKFEAEPAKYLGDRPAPQAMPKGTQYTCPMHPEIIRDKPGSCPTCGMALEPMGV